MPGRPHDPGWIAFKPAIDTLLPWERSWLTMDKVAGILEVSRTDDTQQVVIIHPDLKPDASGVGRLVFSPRHARYLANLLIEHAAAAEAESALSTGTGMGKSTAAPANVKRYSRRGRRGA
jgi:hypothetical protein